jgi:NTE family protein
MGVDVVIAVDVGWQPVKRKELTSALAVSNQAVTIMMQRETGRQRALLGADDVLILPEVGSLQSTDFTEARKAIGLGLAAMHASADKLAKLSVGEDAWKQYIAGRTTQGAEDDRALRQDRQEVRALCRAHPGRARPGHRAAARPEAMDTRLSHFYGSDNFEALDYRLVRDGV